MKQRVVFIDNGRTGAYLWFPDRDPAGRSVPADATWGVLASRTNPTATMTLQHLEEGEPLPDDCMALFATEEMAARQIAEWRTVNRH